MSTELEEALVALVYLGAFAVGIWGLYGCFVLFKMAFGNPVKIELSGDLASDNVWTKQAAEKRAESDIKVAEIHLKIENSQRERAGLPLI